MMVETVQAGDLTLVLHWRGDALAGAEVGYARSMPQATHAENLSAPGREAARALAEYAAGRSADWDNLPLDMSGLTDFQRALLETLRREVGWGRTVSYGELAALAGRPGAARAVGGAMARNPWPLIVPCHRVLGAAGQLTGYTNPAGLDLKRTLLRLEGVAVRGG